MIITTKNHVYSIDQAVLASLLQTQRSNYTYTTMSLISHHIRSFLSGSSFSNSTSQYPNEKNAQSYQLQTASRDDPIPPPPYSSSPSDQSQPKPFILEFQPPSQQGYKISLPLNNHNPNPSSWSSNLRRNKPIPQWEECTILSTTNCFTRWPYPSSTILFIAFRSITTQTLHPGVPTSVATGLQNLTPIKQ